MIEAFEILINLTKLDKRHKCFLVQYTRYKKLQQQLEFLGVQEEYIKDEQRNLKKEYLHAQEEVKRIQSVPLVIGQFLEAVDQVKIYAKSSHRESLKILDNSS